MKKLMFALAVLGLSGCATQKTGDDIIFKAKPETIAASSPAELDSQTEKVVRSLYNQIYMHYVAVALADGESEDQAKASAMRNMEQFDQPRELLKVPVNVTITKTYTSNVVEGSDVFVVKNTNNYTDTLCAKRADGEDCIEVPKIRTTAKKACVEYYIPNVQLNTAPTTVAATNLAQVFAQFERDESYYEVNGTKRESINKGDIVNPKFVNGVKTCSR